MQANDQNIAKINDLNSKSSAGIKSKILNKIKADVEASHESGMCKNGGIYAHYPKQAPIKKIDIAA